MMSLVWNIPIAQPGLAAWLCSPQLLHTCPGAEHGRLEKVLNFLAMTKNVSVINTLLILNPKHSSYWEEN